MDWSSKNKRLTWITYFALFFLGGNLANGIYHGFAWFHFVSIGLSLIWLIPRFIYLHIQTNKQRTDK
jgi:hypothetical protein